MMPLRQRRLDGLGGEADHLVQKVLGWGIVILIVVWVLANPAGAGSTVHGWITGVVSFFQHLASG
jgi:hypothetical protein